MQDYIIEYKGEEENNIDDIAHFFTELMIDVYPDLSSNTNTTNELFLTQLNPLQNAKSTNIINLLADNIFKHQITSVDMTVSLINLMPYSFTISTNMRYNDS